MVYNNLVNDITESHKSNNKVKEKHMKTLNVMCIEN